MMIVQARGAGRTIVRVFVFSIGKVLSGCAMANHHSGISGNTITSIHIAQPLILPQPIITFNCLTNQSSKVYAVLEVFFTIQEAHP
jgi:hypothetical protein